MGRWVADRSLVTAAVLGALLSHAAEVHAQPPANKETPAPAQASPASAPAVQATAPAPSSNAQQSSAPTTSSTHQRKIKAPSSGPALEPRRGGSNYFSVGLYDSSEEGSHLVKFQVDLEYDAMRLERWRHVGSFYLTIPIQFLSFWDLFDTLDGAKSAPFVETDYSVGGEVGWVAPWRRLWMLRSGMLHQSNGLGFLAGSTSQLLQSRSWNRAYLETIHELVDVSWVRVELAAAGWLPFGSAEVVQWDNGEEGGKIEDYVGYWEARPTVVFPVGSWPDIIASARIRQYSVNVELRYSLKGEKLLSKDGDYFRLDVVGQCFYGKAERLITANETKLACYVGLGM